MTRITGLDVADVRFPTSVQLDGSDAMNPEPDYSAAYLVLRTDDPGLAGHALVFTIGRGNDVVCAALRALTPYVLGRSVDALVDRPGAFARELVWDSQLRWLGPEKGVMHMAIGALVNAVWDLRARRAGKPLWRLLVDLPPEDLVAQVDFTYIDDVCTPAQALDLLRAAEPGRAERLADLEVHGLPGYNTSAGWIGYPDDKVDRLVRQAVADGFDLVKLKVGRDLEDDVRRLKIARAAAGPGVRLAVDANQRWGVPEAVRWVRRLAEFDLYWVEEPTSPDDVLGHATIRSAITPIRVATGEHAMNRVLFKQLLQANAVDVVQIDACRVGGVTENLAILLLAARFGVPVYPHAGGVGLCEMVQHLGMYAHVAFGNVGAVEYVDHLHEHFTDPVEVVGGRYRAPASPGGGARLREPAIARYSYPDGPAWADRPA
jgi:L-fuconate dehydratase